VKQQDDISNNVNRTIGLWPEACFRHFCRCQSTASHPHILQPPTYLPK